MWEHQSGKYPRSFTARYGLKRLVYYEQFHDVRDAIAREKQIKSGSREKKIKMIERENAKWVDLSVEMFG